MGGGTCVCVVQHLNDKKRNQQDTENRDFIGRGNDRAAASVALNGGTVNGPIGGAAFRRAPVPGAAMFNICKSTTILERNNSNITVCLSRTFAGTGTVAKSGIVALSNLA